MALLQITKEQYIEFKQKYNKAVETNKDSFMFYEHEFLTSYAKYLLEYMDQQFKG